MTKKAKEKIEELNKTTKKDKIGVVEEATTKSARSKISSKSKTSVTEATSKSKTTKKDKTSIVEKASTKSTSKGKSVTKSKASNKSKSTAVSKVSPVATEYYDLPFGYNQTVVKILAQTPNILFIYWDISNEDRKSYLEKYGKDFFENTRPYLVITNVTMNYTFEVEVNDFANSWYLHINDANCEYKVELKRKFIVNSSDSNKENRSLENSSYKFENYHVNDYLYITSSNQLEMPNDKILFDKLGNTVFFRNTKTNIIERKDISSISFLQKIGKVYNIYDLYKEIYQDELISDEFGLNLPSSSSSSFK